MTGPIAEPPAAAPRRLNLNESPLPPSPHVIAAVEEAARALNRYPGEAQSGLVEAIAAYAGVEAERIVVTAGSSELLHILPFVAGTRPGDEIVLPQPTFPVFAKVAQLHGLTMRHVPVDARGAADVEAILAAIGPKTALVCVATPNNPTGGTIPADALARLCEAMPAGPLFHLDEAYYEFGRVAGGPETLPLLARAKGRWLSSRSASKAFGLAGLRLGYAIASDAALAATCRAIRPQFNVNALALAAGRAALAHADAALEQVAALAAERGRVAAELDALGLRPLPSGANFVAFSAAGLGPDPVAALARQGVLVIGFAMADGAPMIRASTGTRQDNDALLAALAALRP